MTISEPSSGPLNVGTLDIKFDHAGNLWMSGVVIGDYFDGEDILADIMADQLSVGGSESPNLTVSVTNDNSGYKVAKAIAFDKSGNLWVAYLSGGLNGKGGLKMFAATDLSGRGSIAPTPVVTIDSTMTENQLLSIDFPDALAFDDQGSLWVANSQTQPFFGTGSIAKFTPDQLTASGAPIPKVLISANLHNTNVSNPVAITFGPTIP